MTNRHPITPPPELVAAWVDRLGRCSGQEVFTAAAQWGADQELEACCRLIRTGTAYTDSLFVQRLREERRPKPLSLKEQALQQLKDLGIGSQGDAIRLALEKLDD